jgi:hypothetical protein
MLSSVLLKRGAPNIYLSQSFFQLWRRLIILAEKGREIVHLAQLRETSFSAFLETFVQLRQSNVLHDHVFVYRLAFSIDFGGISIGLGVAGVSA